MKPDNANTQSQPDAVDVPSRLTANEAPGDCLNGCAYETAAEIRVSVRGPPPTNAWAGPDYLVESQQTAHERAPREGGLGGGRSYVMDDREAFGPAPILRAPWGDVAEYPSDAWQVNAHQVNHLLDRGLRKIADARAELQTLYGKFYDRVANVASGCAHGVPSWISQAAREGTVRRLMHAVVTSAPYTIVLAGHSAAQASGNHFNQSYSHWLHSLLAPPLAAVGVELVTRNHAMGGLASHHRASCFAAAYGADVDAVLWDYAMTAGSSAEMDYFFKQAMSQPRRPLLIGFQPISSHMSKCSPRIDPSVSHSSSSHTDSGGGYSRTKYDLWQLLSVYERQGYHVAGVSGHVGGWQTDPNETNGESPFATSSDEQAVTSLPPGVRFLHCRSKSGQLLTDACRKYAYDCHCFDDYKSVPDLRSRHAKECGGAASWHPGWREHRLRGHMAAAILLDVLEIALTQFQQEASVGSLPLEPTAWHVAPLFEEQARAVSTILALPDSPCDASPGYSALGCNVTYECATEFAPRVGLSIADIVVLDETKLTSNLLARGQWVRNDPSTRGSSSEGSVEACPSSGHVNSRGYYEALDHASGWLVLKLMGVREGVFILNAWGVSTRVVNCGTTDWGTVTTRHGQNISGVPNAELRLNGKLITSCEPAGNLRGASIARVPELAGAGTVELAVRATPIHHHHQKQDSKSADAMAVSQNNDSKLEISHVMWR